MGRGGEILNPTEVRVTVAKPLKSEEFFAAMEEDKRGGKAKGKVAKSKIGMKVKSKGKAGENFGEEAAKDPFSQLNKKGSAGAPVKGAKDPFGKGVKSDEGNEN
jgi:hypothetical protein